MGTTAYLGKGQGQAKGTRERWGKEEEEEHRVVRGRWAPRPIEEKGSTEGQQMVIGQYAPPAADNNNTQRWHANPPPPPFPSLRPPATPPPPKLARLWALWA